MKNNLGFIYILFVLFSVSYANSMTNKDDSLKYEILMSKKMINDNKIEVDFTNTLDISSKRHIIISSTNQFYALGWGGLQAFGKKPWGRINSFAFTPDSLLMIVRNNELCTFDSLGNLAKLYKLPNQGMGISAGEKVMYLFDRNSNLQKHAIYVLAYGGKYLKLFEINTPISAVCEINNAIYFSTNNNLYKYDLINKKFKSCVNLSNKKSINSITGNPKNNRIFFSTDSVVYTLKDTIGEVITNNFSGTLKYFNDGLIVFNPENKFLMRIVNIENQLKSNKKTSKAPITNSVTPSPITTKTIEPQAAQTSTITSITPTPITTKTIEPQVTQTSTIAPVATSSIATAVSVTTNTASPTRQPTKELLNNQDIIKMVKAKVSNSLIINIIKTSDANFDLKIESIIFLSNQGVSSDVIAEMKNAMDTKNGNK